MGLHLVWHPNMPARIEIFILSLQNDDETVGYMVMGFASGSGTRTYRMRVETLMLSLCG